MNKKGEFLADLIALLEKHGVEFTSDDHREGWGAQDVRITAEFDDYTVGEIDFGRYIDVKKLQDIFTNGEPK